MTRPEPVSAHALLVEQHAFLRRLARSLVADPERADDLAQDVALQALRRPPRATGSPRAWLARVLRNRAVSVARSETRRRDREADLPERTPPPTPPELEERYRVQRAVVEAVGRLDEPYRTVVMLRYDGELSPSAIAERLGLPLSTVKTRLARALERLRRDLDAHDEPGTPTWSVVLLAGLEDLRPAAASAAAAAGGAIVGAKLTVATAVATALLAGVWWSVRDSASPAGGDATSTVEPVARLSASQAPEAEEPSTPAATTTRAGLGAPPSGASPGTPEWSLVLRPVGDFDVLEGPVRVEVSDGTDVVPALRHELMLQPHWTLDVGRFFDGEAPRPAHLRVSLDHAGLLPVESAVLVPESWSAPDAPGGRLSASIQLRRAHAVVEGEVRVPEGAPERTVRVALHTLVDGLPSPTPVERVQFRGAGRFRLRADRVGPHVVVASTPSAEDRAPLRPATWTGALASGETRAIEPLELSSGLAIEGFVDGDPGTAHVVGFMPRPSRWQTAGALLWSGGRFENNAASVATEEGGRFRIEGLGPMPYALRAQAARLEDREPGTARFVTADPQRVEVRAPASGVRLQVPSPDVVTFTLTCQREPAPRVRVKLGFDGAARPMGTHMTVRSDDEGRLRLAFDTTQGLNLVVSDPRFEPQAVRFEPEVLVNDARLSVALERARSDSATLRVRYEPGPAPSPSDKVTLSAFELSTWSEDELHALLTSTLPSLYPVPIRAGSDAFALVDRARRDGESWTFDDLKPGSYLVHATVDSPEGAPPSMLLGETFTVDLTAADDRTHTWFGRRGGLVRVEFAGAGARVSLLDHAGRSLPVRFREVGRTRSHYASVERAGAYDVLPALPAGDYSLRVESAGQPVRSVPLRVDAGRTTDVRVDLSRP